MGMHCWPLLQSFKPERDLQETVPGGIFQAIERGILRRALLGTSLQKLAFQMVDAAHFAKSERKRAFFLQTILKSKARPRKDCGCTCDRAGLCVT